jgi:hypothetical protein
MATTGKRGSFADEQTATETEAILVAMVQDNAYNTDSSYSANSILYPDNIIPFVDKHMQYLRTHSIDPQYYLSNLRLMVRIR